MTAIANLAFARATGGRLLLRIDDTDRERSTPESLDAAIDVLGWLGVTWDEGPRFQSKRDDCYQQQLDVLLAAGHAYYCFCTPERLEQLRGSQRAAGKPPRYDEHCRSLSEGEIERLRNLGQRPVVRLRVPDRAFDFTDAIRGQVAGPIGSFDDFVLQRSDGSFGYLFASVVDDIEFGMTHVLRGEDHLPNTPRQLAVFHALDIKPPEFAHLPLLLVEDGNRKLSKRDPLGTLEDLRSAGFTPLSVRRYLAELLGQGAVDLLAPGATAFALGKVQRSSPHVSRERLVSIAREDIAALGRDELLGQLLEAGLELPVQALPLFDDLRGQAASVAQLCESLRAVLDGPHVADGSNVADDSHAAPEPAADEVLEEAARLLEAPGEESVEAYDGLMGDLRAWGKSTGRRVPDTLQPVRRALTGEQHGPPLPLVLYAVGRQEARARMQGARSSRLSGTTTTATATTTTTTTATTVPETGAPRE